MTRHDLESVALTLVSEGKGILAADETISTLTKRFDTLGIQSTEQSRRSYREMLVTSPGVAEFISGVIMYDETIRQKSTGGMSLAEVQTVQGIIPGIKVDTGAKPLAGSPDERGLTVYDIASRSAAPWVPVLRSGGRSSMSRTLYRVSPA